MTREAGAALPATILVADDDRTQCAIIAAAAGRIGHGVIATNSVEDAAARLRVSDFQTVIVDLAIGERDGIELLRAVATLRPAPRVIIVSGCEERILNAAARFARTSGITEVFTLAKPLVVGRLQALIGAPPAPTDAPRPEAPAPLVTAAAIARGLDNGEIFPVFQPKIALDSGRVAGCEALARWSSPELGMVDPADFIALAEASGQVGDVTRAILRRAIDAARSFLRSTPDFVLAVNVSAALLSDISLPDEIERMLSDAGVPPQALLLEITESVAMADISRAIDVLVRLRIKGIGLAIDDFGTGYSSMAALARMPFSELKIDQSFVRGCLDDPDLMKIVRASVAIAREFSMSVVAEGIEDEVTRKVLAGLGCDLGQGYLFAGALPQDEFERWLAARAGTPALATRQPAA
jgi:EAL domain-containing protein (putative c-di-GMP-specific phosphodiesterase class I)/ActR/RegA family two-component response regulator